MIEKESVQPQETIEDLEHDLKVIDYRRRILLNTQLFDVYNERTERWEVLTMHLEANPDPKAVADLEHFEMAVRSKLNILKAAKPDSGIRPAKKNETKAEEDITLEFVIERD